MKDMDNIIEKIKVNVPIGMILSRMGLIPNNTGKILSIYKDEKTPSMQIYFKTNSYYDYSSNKGGDVINLYEDYYKISKSEAIKELAEIGGLNQSISNNISRNRKEHIPIAKKNEIGFELLESEKELFDEKAGLLEYDSKLSRDKSEQIAYNFILKERERIQINIYDSLFNLCNEEAIGEQEYQYLTGIKRGLTERTLNQFRIFTINNYKETTEFLKDSYSKDELLISGLFTQNDYFVFSKHKIIIPFIENGIIKYLRGRYFYNGNANPTANYGKYIGLTNFSTNLTSKRFFNKDILKNIPPFSDLLITEGEFDCMVTNQNEINSIGISGVSSFPKDSINELEFYNIFLAFDSDEAGQKASIEIAKLFKKQIKIIKLMNYKDLTELMSYEK